MKLELKHLAPYLPYDLEVINGFADKVSLHTHFEYCYRYDSDKTYCKPLLRPLSDLTKRIDDDESNLTYSAFLKLYTQEDLEYAQTMTLGLDYETIRQLFEWHFDVFGLIDKGLAIDKNNTPTPSTVR